MSPAMIAVGLGCRSGCDAAEIAALVRRALGEAGLPPGVPARLFAPERKRNEPGLRGAAELLALPLALIDHRALAAAQDRTVTRSARALAAVGLSSVAEAAALVGAGPRSRLLLPRVASSNATCALAVPEICP